METTLTQILNLSDRQEAYYQLVDYYLKADANEQANIRKEWDFGVQWVYPKLERLACHLNEMYHPKAKIIAALTATSLQDLRTVDWRDELVGIAFIYHSCLLVKVSPQEVFERVASASSPETAKFLRDFYQRDPKDKSLEAFDLQIVTNPDGEKEVHSQIQFSERFLDFLEKNCNGKEMEEFVKRWREKLNLEKGTRSE